jgi:hypothetical protein
MVVEVKMPLQMVCQFVGGNISQAYSGRGALPFQRDFAKGSFGAFQL